MSDFPIDYEADYVEPRSRLTTFFRLIMIIPIYIVAIVYSIAVFFTWLAAWIAVFVTGRYPDGLYRFNAGFIQFSTRWLAYYHLVTDDYPPFGIGPDDSYPVRVQIAPPKEKYGRLHAFFRWITVIPSAIVAWALLLVAGLCSIVSWFAIVFTGKQMQSMQDLINMGIGYQAKYSGYAFLLHEEWFPPISEDASSSGGAIGSGGPPAQSPTSSSSGSSTFQ